MLYSPSSLCSTFRPPTGLHGSQGLHCFIASTASSLSCSHRLHRQHPVIAFIANMRSSVASPTQAQPTCCPVLPLQPRMALLLTTSNGDSPMLPSPPGAIISNIKLHYVPCIYVANTTLIGGGQFALQTCLSPSVTSPKCKLSFGGLFLGGSEVCRFCPEDFNHKGSMKRDRSLNIAISSSCLICQLVFDLEAVLTGK